MVFLYSPDESTGTLLVGAPFVTTLPVYRYTASRGSSDPKAFSMMASARRRSGSAST